MSRENLQSEDNDVAGVLERLAAAVGASTEEGLASSLGVSRKTVAGWRYRRTKPYEHCEKVAEERGVGLDWLLLGRPDSKLNLIDAPTHLVGIPLLEVEASAGGGTAIYSDELADVMRFDQDWIKREVGVPAQHLRLISVRGDSMEGTLRAGDVMFVDVRESTFQHEGIYVLRIEDTVLVKRLQRMPDGSVKVVSDNKLYDSYVLQRGQDVAIIGRVVLKIQRT